MLSRRERNRIADERKHELLEAMPYCPCGAPTTAFHHIKRGCGVKDHARGNLVGVCELCHRRIHNAKYPDWYKEGETR